jgi:N-acetylmuramoyl-L-alanine amidase
MGARWLTDLADVCRAAGLVVYEVDGWQTRSRSSGGFGDGAPGHVMVHHTASGASSDGWPDVNYMCFGSDIRPVANLYLSRPGEVYVMAAGATNTNGQGSDPCGAVPDDSMNTDAVGIEAGNDGVGEPWPVLQQDAYIALVGALVDAYRVDPARVHGHAEYAVGRKIDPAGPSRWAPAGGTWPMDPFRAEIAAGAPNPPEGDDMAAFAYYRDDRADGWQIWAVALDAHGQAWTCPISDLPDAGKWDAVQPIVGDPPVRPFAALVALMDRQNRPAP